MESLFGFKLVCKMAGYSNVRLSLRFQVTQVSVKVNFGISLKFHVFANLESVGCEVPYIFPEKKFLKN